MAEAPQIPSPTFHPVARPDRVEFASAEWRALADSYLSAQFERHGGDIGDDRIVVVERYTNAPPHIADADGDITFHLIVDPTGARVVHGDHAEPDFRVTADHTRGQWVATAVYEQMPERAARLQRETTHLFGDVFTTEGAFPTSPGALRVLAGLHDHVGRRTIPGTDLAFRIERLGLQDRVDELSERGYTVLESVISEAMADELEADLRRLIQETRDAGGQGHAASMLLARGPLWEEIALHPLVHTLAQHMVGEDCNLGQSLGFTKLTGQDTHQMHNDPPHPLTGNVCCNLTTIWALQDFTEDAGPTLIVPGSHKLNCHPAANARERAEKILMPKGSVAMWHGSSWHGAAIRDADGDRITIHNTYLRNWVRTFDNYLHIDPAILDRNPVGLTMLCGLDDYYMKNTLSGPDYRRLA